jgi:hypothetical protein
MGRFAQHDFTVAVGRRTNCRATTIRVGAMPSSALCDLGLCFGRELVSVLVSCHKWIFGIATERRPTATKALPRIAPNIHSTDLQNGFARPSFDGGHCVRSGIDGRTRAWRVFDSMIAVSAAIRRVKGRNVANFAFHSSSWL